MKAEAKKPEPKQEQTQLVSKPKPADPPRIRADLYSCPPNIEGASCEELVDALHLFERQYLVASLQKIFRELVL